MDIPQIVYSDKYINLMVLLLGLVLVLYFLSRLSARKRVLTFGNFETLEKVLGKKMLPWSFFILLLRILAIIVVVLILSDVEVIQDGYIAKSDFVLAIDTSASMMTPDYEPTRLGLVKEALIDWIGKVEGTKIGLVTFSGRAYVKTKPTFDMEELAEQINNLHWEEPAGTAIGDAIVSSASILNGADISSRRNNTIILVTDGRNNAGVNISAALDSINESQIKILAIGVGSKTGIESEVPPELRALNATASEFPNLDTVMLKRIANETKGDYEIIDDEDSIKHAFETALEYRKVTKSLDKEMLLVLAVLLLADWAFEITKYRPIP
ncbi:MAG: hypothetical protein B6U97_02180 [Candidatus Altiarchaeales archaeon ex4484_96]|nr:MAG: hypothetical protein B6U97_02180 [Candidatus Altiarchaeales archaeon ex4484_96]